MNRGDVVELDWPFSDRKGSKTPPRRGRPGRFPEWPDRRHDFVQITGTRHGLPGTEVELDPAIETGSGLSKVCYASCTNVLTQEQSLVITRIGISPCCDAANRRVSEDGDGDSLKQVFTMDPVLETAGSPEGLAWGSVELTAVWKEP